MADRLKIVLPSSAFPADRTDYYMRRDVTTSPFVAVVSAPRSVTTTVVAAHVTTNVTASAVGPTVTL